MLEEEMLLRMQNDLLLTEKMEKMRRWTSELTAHRSFFTIERFVSIFRNGVIGMVSNGIPSINRTQIHREPQSRLPILGLRRSCAPANGLDNVQTIAIALQP